MMHLARKPKPPKPIVNEAQPSSMGIARQSLSRESLQEDGLYRGDVQVDEELNIHPIYPRGPPKFPPGRVLKHTDAFAGLTFAGILRIMSLSIQRHEMTEDFSEELSLLEEGRWEEEFSPQQIVMPSMLSSSVISRQNYKKLTSWFSVHVPKQEYLHKINISGKFVEKEERVPLRQTIVELKALIEEVVGYQFEEDGSSADTKRSTSQSSDEVKLQEKEQSRRWHVLAGEKARMIHGTRTRYFCGLGRAGSPFQEVDSAVATPSELAVIEGMLHGGHILSLKAHFVEMLPDLAPLSHTLVYLNVSFNELRVFPDTILELKQLVCLKMRNNPLKEIPEGISRLRKLEVLCLSFNLLQALPDGLCHLENLIELDVAHNNLEWLPNSINNLRRLKKLHLEGNELCGLPSSAAQMRGLKRLNVNSNFMDPLLWREMARNCPQRLSDLSCIAYSKQLSPQSPFYIPDRVRDWLQKSNGVCSCCQATVYGCGQRLIRAVPPGQCPRVMRDLPFIFTLCTPTCRVKFRQKIF